MSAEYMHMSSKPCQSSSPFMCFCTISNKSLSVGKTEREGYVSSAAAAAAAPYCFSKYRQEITAFFRSFHVLAFGILNTDIHISISFLYFSVYILRWTQSSRYDFLGGISFKGKLSSSLSQSAGADHIHSM
jgi:hypothetical protein